MRQESGFALIAALLSIMVLTAVGLLVFTVTTQDVRVSSRLVGEKKAFFSSEAGIQSLTQGFDPMNRTDHTKYDKNFPVDPGQDAASTYRIGTPEIPMLPARRGPATIPIVGHETTLEAVRFVATVTGRNATYGSTVQVDVGIGYGPVPTNTTYQ